jgi:hypothetical protein
MTFHNCKTAIALTIIIKKNTLMVREGKGGLSAQGCRRDVFCASHAASYFMWLIDRRDSSGDGYMEKKNKEEGGGALVFWTGERIPSQYLFDPRKDSNFLNNNNQR